MLGVFGAYGHAMRKPKVGKNFESSSVHLHPMPSLMCCGPPVVQCDASVPNYFWSQQRQREVSDVIMCTKNFNRLQ